MGQKHTHRTKTTELTPKKMAALKANTKFSEREIQEWHDRFIRDYPSGEVDEEGFKKLYRDFFDKNQTDNLSKYAFSTFDGSHNGKIDFDEFLLAITPHSTGNVRERLSAAFDLYDHTDDGKIDLNELITLITSMYDLTGKVNREGDQSPQQRAIAMAKHLDVNKDGKISKQEFVSGCLNDPVVHKLFAPQA